MKHELDEKALKTAAIAMWAHNRENGTPVPDWVTSGDHLRHTEAIIKAYLSALPDTPVGEVTLDDALRRLHEIDANELTSQDKFRRNLAIAKAATAKANTEPLVTEAMVERAARITWEDLENNSTFDEAAAEDCIVLKWHMDTVRHALTAALTNGGDDE